MTQPTPVAAPAVLGTYELCELILLQVPMKDVYILQRVNTTWRDTIARSQDLRKKLLRISSETPLKPVANTSTQNLYRALNFGPAYEGQYLKFPSAATSITYALPPFRDQSFGEGSCDHSHHGERHFTHHKSRLGVHIELRSDRRGKMALPIQISCRDINKNTSLRSMLLTQPPVIAVQLQQRYRLLPGAGTDWQPQVTLFNRSGITFGDMFESIDSKNEDDRKRGPYRLIFEQILNIDREPGAPCGFCRYIEHLRED